MKMHLGDTFSGEHGDFSTLFHDTDFEQFVIRYFQAVGEPHEFASYKMVIGFTSLDNGDIMLHMVDAEGVDTFEELDSAADRHGVEFRLLSTIMQEGGFNIYPGDQLAGVLEDEDEDENDENDGDDGECDCPACNAMREIEEEMEGEFAEIPPETRKQLRKLAREVARSPLIGLLMAGFGFDQAIQDIVGKPDSENAEGCEDGDCNDCGTCQAEPEDDDYCDTCGVDPENDGTIGK